MDVSCKFDQVTKSNIPSFDISLLWNAFRGLTS